MYSLTKDSTDVMMMKRTRKRNSQGSVPDTLEGYLRGIVTSRVLLHNPSLKQIEKLKEKSGGLA
jgi:hypothetical protein